MENIMRPIFNYDLDITKNLDLEKLVETELPQEIKKKIAELVFDGKISNIFEASSEEALKQGWSEDVSKEYSSNQETLCKILSSYFDKKVMDVLFRKSSELLQESQNNKQKTQEIMIWYDGIKETATEMLQRWIKESMDYARDVEEKMNKASELTV